MFVSLIVSAVALLTATAAAAPELTMRGRRSEPTFSDICGSPLADSFMSGLGF